MGIGGWTWETNLSAPSSVCQAAVGLNRHRLGLGEQTVITQRL